MTDAAANINAEIQKAVAEDAELGRKYRELPGAGVGETTEVETSEPP